MRETTDRLNTKIQEQQKEKEIKIENPKEPELTDEEIDRMIRELERKKKILRCKLSKKCHTSINFEKSYGRMQKKVEEMVYFYNLLHFIRRYDIINGERS